MQLNLVEKIFNKHLDERYNDGSSEIALIIDNTLTQDSTGTMAYLQFESLEIPRAKTEFSVSFVDHNTLQTGFENADDHKYLQTVAYKHGVYFSKPGNGICHQVFLERFAKPGKTLLGSDSHTPTAGAMGMIAIGAGGLDIAVAMAGNPYFTQKPKVCKVELKGCLSNGVAAKDIILELLRVLTVKGGVGWIFEYSGDGLASLTVPQRATITNMGAELGATTSIFPSDEKTLEFLKKQDREQDWIELKADVGAVYDKEVVIDLDKLEPLAACPHSPDNVKKIADIANLKVNQVLIGSCTNASYDDLMTVAGMIKGKTIHPDVSLGISPGSKQVMSMLAENGALTSMIDAGARILECACGPCIGMGQSPASNAVSLRTFNRNFPGRSGTVDASVYLVSPEVAVCSALTGKITDPREYDSFKYFKQERAKYSINDNMVIEPSSEFDQNNEIVRGRNIIPLKKFNEMPDKLIGKVLLKVSDNISTDAIMPSHAKLLPFRSNIPYLAEHCFEGIDVEFPARAHRNNGGFIIGGENYGQGSSREHAALVPRFLGIKAVLAKSFARIHRANLINMGIVPLVFVNSSDYDRFDLDLDIEINNIHDFLKQDSDTLTVRLKNSDEIKVRLELSIRQKNILLVGGLLNYSVGVHN